MTRVSQVSRVSKGYGEWCELSKLGEYRKLSHHHDLFDTLHVFTRKIKINKAYKTY